MGSVRWLSLSVFHHNSRFGGVGNVSCMLLSFSCILLLFSAAVVVVCFVGVVVSFICYCYCRWLHFVKHQWRFVIICVDIATKKKKKQKKKPTHTQQKLPSSYCPFIGCIIIVKTVTVTVVVVFVVVVVTAAAVQMSTAVHVASVPSVLK